MLKSSDRWRKRTQRLIFAVVAVSCSFFSNRQFYLILIVWYIFARLHDGLNFRSTFIATFWWFKQESILSFQINVKFVDWIADRSVWSDKGFYVGHRFPDFLFGRDIVYGRDKI